MNTADRPNVNTGSEVNTEPGIFDLHQASSRRSFILLGLGAIIGLGIAGYGLFTAAGTVTNTVPPEYVALVNHRPIYRTDYTAQLQTTYQVTFAEATKQQREQTLNDMINEELLVQRGLEGDLASYDPDVRNALVSGVELQMYADVQAKQPTDEELHAWYDAHRDQYSSLGVYQLRDLVMNQVSGESSDAAKQRALDAVAALRAGQDIEKVKSKYQLRDSLRLQQGGKADLGDIFDFAAQANLQKEVFAVLKKMSAGQVSDPITVSGDGQHILVVTKYRAAEALGFDAVRSRVWTDIKNADQEKVRNSTLTFLRNKSEILTADVVNEK